MLILENISYQTTKKTFNNSSKRKIKFTINQTLVTSQSIARVRSQTLLEWSEAIALPLFFNTQYAFEIFEEHKFGYNPEELAVICGKITISEQDRFCTWQASTERGKKIGFLSANIRRKLRYAPDVNTDVPESQIVSISSIIAHISDLKQKRGYIVLTVDKKQFSTQLSKSKSGELLFTEHIEIQKTEEILEATVEVFEYNAKEDNHNLLASGLIKFDDKLLEKRVVVKNEKGVVAGDIFIDYKISSREAYNTAKELTKIVQHQRSKLSASKVDHTATLNSSRTINVSRNIGQYAVRLPLSKKDRVSVVNHNTKIFMPTERRFVEYKDKQNNNVSYLKDRNSMDFKNEHAKAYYKGASIGKGNKSVFTTLQTPGVGGYNLPSIWDRY